MGVLLDGFLTGLLLQAAIGPVFFFVLNTTIQRTVLDGLLAVLGVILVDYFYIFLAAIGVGKLLARPRIRLVMQIVSSTVLVGFGVMMIITAAKDVGGSGSGVNGQSACWVSFISALLLTLSSPLTIVFWTSLFATKALEKGYNKRQLVPFGLGAGASTAVFLGLAVLVFSLLRSSIPQLLVRLLNAAVGTVLVVYGIVRLFKGIKKNASPDKMVDSAK